MILLVSLFNAGRRSSPEDQAFAENKTASAERISEIEKQLIKSIIKAELVKPPRLGGLVKVALFLLYIVGNTSFFPAPII